MTSLRVLHVLDHSLPLHSGYAFRTLAIVREQRRLGWETFQLTTPKQGPCDMEEEPVAEGLRFHRTPAPPGAGPLAQMWRTARRLERLCDALAPDLIHAHSPALAALPAIRVGRRRGVPVVYEMRASWEDAAVDHGTTREGSLRYRASRALETLALRRADQVTTICEGLRREIAGRGVAPEKVTVIPNAVDAQSFRAGAAPDPALRARLGLEGRTVLGFAGSFYGYEGLHLLVAAVARLRWRRPALALLLVGGGPQEAALREQVAREGLEGVVVFAGRVPHAEVQRYYDLIEVLAYPRLPMRLTELVTPLKPLEAMAQGRMLVASDVGGHRELIRDGETGFLCRAGSAEALADTIEHVLALRASWDGLRERARAFVERERTWAASVARYRGVYARALGGRPAGLALGMEG